MVDLITLSGNSVNLLRFQQYSASLKPGKAWKFFPRSGIRDSERFNTNNNSSVVIIGTQMSRLKSQN